MSELELYVLVDENGDYVVSKNLDDLQEAWDNDIGGDVIGTRVLRVVLKVEASKVVDVCAVVPASDASVSMAVSG